MKKKLLFIFNPFSGKGQIKSKLLAIVDQFVKHGYEVTIHPTQKPQDAMEQVEEHAGKYDLVVCSGGDGTLDEVVSGMMRRRQKIPIGYVPSGSTNDFACSLQLPKSMEEAAKLAVSGVPFSCDVGKFNGSYFVYIAAFGLFTDVSYATSQERKNRIGHFAYIIEGIKRVSAVQSYHLRISYGKQVWTVISVLFSQYVPDALKARFALRGMTKYLSVLNTTNDIFSVSEKRWNGAEEIYTKRTAELPIFADMLRWLSYVGEDDWGSAFTLRFQLGQHYLEQESREKGRQYSYQNRRRSYLEISEYVKCYVRGVWDKDLFYKAIFTFSDLGSLLEPVSTVTMPSAGRMRLKI